MVKKINPQEALVCMDKGFLMIDDFLRDIKHSYKEKELRGHFHKYEISRKCDAMCIAQLLLDFLHAHFASATAQANLTTLNSIQKKVEGILSSLDSFIVSDGLGLKQLLYSFQERLEIIKSYQESNKKLFAKKSARRKISIEGKVFFSKIKYHLFELINYFHETQYSDSKEAAIIEVQQLLTYLSLKKNHEDTAESNLKKEYFVYRDIEKRILRDIS